MNDITIDAVLGRLENGQREFVDEDDELGELALLGIIRDEVRWNSNGDMEITVVTRFTPPPSRHFLQPYRALRDIQKKLDTMRSDEGIRYEEELTIAARLISRRLLELETE